jgi:hypothetical protein
MNQLYTKTININNDIIKEEIYIVAKTVKTKYLKKIKNSPDQLRYFGKGSLTSKLWRFYNLFSYKQNTLDLLFYEIRNFFIEIYNPDEDYIINSWVNIHKQGEGLPWHGHWPILAKSFHGYYCVNVEPSTTTYKFLDNDNFFINNNKNNMIIIGKSNGDMHCTSEWKKNEDRISIAFDIIPKNMLTLHPTLFENYNNSAFIDFFVK